MSAPAPSPAVEHAARILEAAREALGGSRLAAVKTLVGNGQTRRLRGNNIQPIEFEIAIELPDKYVRKDEFPAEESDPTTTGFSGSTLLAPPGGLPAPSPAQLEVQNVARVNAVKQDFVRFALGLFASSFETYPLTFSYLAEAEAPQGKADVLDVKGPANFALRLFISAATHLPIMVSWQTPPSNVIITVPGQPPPETVAPGAVVVVGPTPPAPDAPQADKDQYAQAVMALRSRTLAAAVEHRLYYQDYRQQDGLQWPFRFRRAIGADTTEETTFDRYRFNVRIDPKKFEPAR